MKQPLAETAEINRDFSKSWRMEKRRNGQKKAGRRKRQRRSKKRRGSAKARGAGNLPLAA